MQDVKFRLVNPALAPRRTKLEMPGWAGQPKPRADDSHEYPWHCALFTEGAQYGIELFYPYENELRASKEDGKWIFDGDFGPQPESDLPPFRGFGTEYYTHQLLLDLKVARSGQSGLSHIRASTPTRPARSRSRSGRCCAASGGR